MTKEMLFGSQYVKSLTLNLNGLGKEPVVVGRGAISSHVSCSLAPSPLTPTPSPIPYFSSPGRGGTEKSTSGW